MGLGVIEPRQLAPTVGTKQVGSMVSTVPSSTLDNSATPATKLDESAARMESILFGSLGFVPHLPILQSIFADLDAGADLTFGGFRIYVNRWGTLRLADQVRSPLARPSSAPAPDAGS